jgi:cytochrome bd-type quinol oxidase subunit 2
MKELIVIWVVIMSSWMITFSLGYALGRYVEQARSHEYVTTGD